MLDTADTGKKVSTAGEPWKKQVSKSLDKSRMYVWKRDLPSDLQAFAAVFFHAPLQKYNYEGAVQPRSSLIFYPTMRNTISQNDVGFIAAAFLKIRLTPTNEGLKPEHLLYLPSDSQGSNSSSLISAILFLMKRKIMGKQSYYFVKSKFPNELYRKLYRVIFCVLARKLSVHSYGAKSL